MADSREQHVSATDFSLGDNEEDSAGFGVSRPPKKTDQSDRECIYDGRLSTPTVKFMLDTIAKCDPSNTNDKGGFGKVYFYKDKHPKLGIPVAIKEVIIEETSEKLKMMSIINERLASRTLHYAIVPLLAMTEDKSKRAFYFLSPYLENGDLFQTLKDDTEKINAGKINDVTLPKQRRLKILYHIGSALNFLHTHVKDIRGPIIHMDVKSLNIVLDADFNARLIDFGLAREMLETESGIPVTKTEIGGTDGYFPTRGYSVLTKYEDYHNFGVVGLECLTGLPPHNPNDRDGDLRVQHMEKLRDKIQDIWLADDDIGPDAESVLQMCIKCIASPTKKNISSAEICRNLQVHLHRQGISSWDRQHKLENKCEICMINPAVADDVLTHMPNCSCNINVCIACIRNSYVNNIKCHSCDADIFPTIGKHCCKSFGLIGHFWAALLIVGNDVKNSKVAGVFKKDIMEVYRLIVSMCPRIIGIRPENVFVVEAEAPGLKANLKGKLESVVEKLSKISIQTILLYYSGHSDENGFDLENDEVHLTEEEFSTHMKRIVTSENAATDSQDFRNAISRAVSPKRIICFLDCCHPPNLTVLQDRHVCVIQVNACRSKCQSMLETSGSVFTKFFIQAFTQSAYGKECFDEQCKCTPIEGDFITVGQLVAYMRSHMKRYQARRNIETYNAPEKHEMCVTDHDEKIAFNIDFLEQLEFRFKDPDISSDMIKIKPNLISDMQDLSRMLFSTFIEQKFLALSIDETDSDVYKNCICVEIDKGPKETEELDTIEKVMKAWNSRRDLAVSLRGLANIRRGMVLLNLHPVEIQEFLVNTSITSPEICSVTSNSRFAIPFAAIPELKRRIGRKPEGELKCFRDHLSDIMNACRLEENEDALISIILPNTRDRSEDRRKLPFVCYRVTITEKLQQETSTEGEWSINTENGGKDETVPKQVYDNLTTHQRYMYETSTNIEMNTPFGNQTPTDQIGAQKISDPYLNNTASSNVSVRPSKPRPGHSMSRQPSRGTLVQGPYVEIVEQPYARGLRFRYECEGRSAGGILGETSTPERKTFPSIKIHNYSGPAVIVVSCVTKEGPYKPHPHNLVGKDCRKGVCTLRIRDTTTVSFPLLGIQCAKKEDVDGNLKMRQDINVDPFQTGFKHKGQNIDLNVVRLCFQVFLPDEHGKITRIVPPVVSQAIHDEKGREKQEQLPSIEDTETDKTVPKYASNTSTIYKMSRHSEVEKNAQSLNQIPSIGVERGGATGETRTESRYVPSERSIQFGFPEYRMDRKPREGREEQERLPSIEETERDKTVPEYVSNTSAIYKMSRHSEVEKNAQSLNQIPSIGVERGGATGETRAESRYVPSERSIQFGFPEYRMDRKPRGYCVILNNTLFYVEKENSEEVKLPDRNGTDIDAERLTNTFEKLHFIVRQENNLSDSEMMIFLRNISQNADNGRYDCFVCAILTHGVMNHVYGANGKLVLIKDITAIFHSSRCETLSGKPKIFFIQACQGINKMTGTECRDENVDIETDTVASDKIGRTCKSLGSNESTHLGDAENSVRSTDFECDAPTMMKEVHVPQEKIIPEEADFLIGYATVAGYVSFRSKDNGSLYIRKLCEILSSHADRIDLLSILTEVSRQVSETNASLDGGLFKQVPAPYSTLRKLVFFRTIDEPQLHMQKHSAPLQGHQEKLKKSHDQTQECPYQLQNPRFQETHVPTQGTSESMLDHHRRLRYCPQIERMHMDTPTITTTPMYTQENDQAPRQRNPDEDYSIIIYERSTGVPNSESKETKASTIPDKDQKGDPPHNIAENSAQNKSSHQGQYQDG